MMDHEVVQKRMLEIWNRGDGRDKEMSDYLDSLRRDTSVEGIELQEFAQRFMKALIDSQG